MRKALFFLACFSVLISLNGASAEEMDVKIGFLSPQTGPIADYAEGFEMGGEIAIDDLNAKYEGEYYFELVIADSACDGDQSDDAAQELVNEGVIGIAGAACSGATLGAMPVAKDAQIPLVSYASTSPAITDADDDGYLWRVVPADTFFSTGVADLVDSQNVRGYNSAIIYIQGDYFEDSAMAFKDSWEERQYEVCNLQGIEVGQDDFSQEVDNIESDGCDNVVIFSSLEEMVGIIEEIRDQNVDIGIFGGAFVDPESFVNSFGDEDDVDGVYTVDGARWDVHNPAVREHYDDECNDRSNNCEDYIYHYEAYDAVNIIAEAFVLGGGDRDDVNSFIDDIGDTYIGATYTMFFDENGDVGGVGFNFCKYYMGPNEEVNCDGVWNPRFGILDEKVDIPLGFLNPLTGPIDIYAEGFTVSWDVAIDHLNEIYGFLNFEMNEEDSGCDSTTAATAAQNLVDNGVYAIAGAACSAATLGAMDITSQNQIPQVAYPSTSPAITDADDDGYLWRVVPSDAQQGQAIGDLVAYYGLENPAIIYMTNDYGTGTANAVENRLNEYNIEVCTKISYNDGESDFYDEVEEIKDNGCDSMVMISYADDGAAIIEELRDQDVNIPVFGGDGIADQAFLNEFSDPSDAEGVFATRGRSWASYTEGEYFDADYNVKCEEEYDGGDCEDNPIYLREAYDSVMILGRAIYAAGYPGLEGEAIRDMLPYVGRSYQGASGLIDFDENGDISGNGFDICRFEYVEDDLEFICRGTWTLNKGIKGVDFEVIISYHEPTAIIYYYDAAPFVTGYSYFFGDGHAYGGEVIVAYEWYSDIDSVFGDTQDVPAYLSAGAHNISFRVQDSVGNWSEPESIMVFVYEMPKLIIDKTVGYSQGGSSLKDIHWHPEFEERYDDDDTQWWEGEFEVFACVRLNNVSFDENLDWDSGCENAYGWEYLYIWDDEEFVTNYTWDPYDYGHYDVSVAFYFWYVFDVYVSEPDHFGYTVWDFYPEIVFEEDPEETIFGEPVTFSAYGIHDDCGEYCAEISGYQWISDLDGQLSENGTFTTDGLSMGMHQITFIVEMYKEGVYSSTVRESFSVWVYANPVAHAGEDVIVQPGDNVQFAGAGTDEDGDIISFEWDLNGDGIFEFKSYTGITTFIYNDEGEFVTILRVTDDDGHTAIDERLVTVVSEEEEELIQEEKVIPGCTYENALNYDPEATEDDDSCDFGTEPEPITIPEDSSLPSLSLIASVGAITIIALRRRH
jgi:branched-chain amino acid transport system substrate-binding protein